MKQIGKVWLLGAGPSDPELLTLKGKRVLEQAQVVIYDKLVGAGILSMLPPAAQQIDVGKTAGSHPVPQEEINRLLLRYAREGKRVVRLKGGDPFVFGRGGEELELLSQHEIPFEVVPGITSAVSVPAYAGIPVTHRNLSSSVHIVTGHAQKGKPLSIPYRALVEAGGTLIFLMGVSALKEICEGLLFAGVDPQMPAAVLERGTTAYQRRIVGTVSDLFEKAAESQIKTPAIVVVGEVCRLSKQFHWAEDRPLGHQRIIVTRPRKRASDLSAMLRELGAEVIELPSIETVRLKRNTLLGQAISVIAVYDWIVFTSPEGVDLFFEELKERRVDVRKLSHLKFAAIGSATKKAVEDRGILVEYTPSVYSTEFLAKGLVRKVHRKERVLIPRSVKGSKVLTDILSEHHISFDDVPLYDIKTEKMCPIKLFSEDLVTFTSASTVKGFAERFQDLDFTKVRAVCIGEQTAAEARRFGMEAFVAEEATIASMVEKILALAEE